MKLYDFQRRAVELVERRNGFAGLFMDMGTGKTPTALSALARRGVRRILIICPLAAIRVWQNEIRKVGAHWDVITLARGTIEKRAERLSLLKDNGRPQCVIVNYDAYWRYAKEAINKRVRGKTVTKVYPLRALRKALLAYAPDAIVADEAHRLKKHTTKQSKFIFELSAQPQVLMRLALTGTPVANGTEDLFSIYRFIDPSVFGTNYADFERRYVIRGGYGGYQIVGYRNQGQVKAKVDASAFQIDIEDAFELPQRTSIVVPVELEAKARRAYEQMKRDSLALLEVPGPDGQPIRGKALASIVLTTLTRLQQIAGGAVPVLVAAPSGDPYGDKGKHPQQIEWEKTDVYKQAAGFTETQHMAIVGDEKIRAAQDIVADALAAERQVVIFCRYTNEIKRLVGAFPHHYKDDGDACLYCGKPVRSSLHLKPMAKSWVDSMSGNRAISGSIGHRDRVREDFAKGRTRVLVMQIALGVSMNDLVAGSVAIFYSTGYSLLDFLQARKRLYRHGQTKKVTEYFLQVENSIDETIFKALSDKQQIARKVTSLRYAKGLISGPKAKTR